MSIIHPSSSHMVSTAANSTVTNHTSSSSSTWPLRKGSMSSSTVAPLPASSRYLASATTHSNITAQHSGNSSNRPSTAWKDLSSSSSSAIAPSSRVSPHITPISSSDSVTVISPALMPTSSIDRQTGTTVAKTSDLAKVVLLKSSDFWHMIAEFTPEFLGVNRASFIATAKALGQICCQKFLVPCGFENAIPRTAANNADYASAYISLSKYNQMLSDVYRDRVALTQFSAYSSLHQTVPVSLGIFPLHLKAPVNILGDEEAFAKKRQELARYLAPELLPPRYENYAAVLGHLSYFLAEAMKPATAPDIDPAASPGSATSSNSPAEIAGDPPPPLPEKLRELLAETAKLIIRDRLEAHEVLEAQEALRLEVAQRAAQDPTFLSRLFRYTFDLILSSHSRNHSYRAQLYSIATSFVTHCDQYLSYEDLHYALLIHFHMVLNRMDVQGKEQILQPKLIEELFKKIKIKKTALDQERREIRIKNAALNEVKHAISQNESQGPGLAALKEHLDILLSNLRYVALAHKMLERGGREDLFKIKMFNGVDPDGETRYQTLLALMREHFSDPTNESKVGCCVIL